jgi:hypothetical protein
MAPRTIDDRFLADLKSGMLNPILDKVQHDDTLMLALREGYINIYYRGGSILKLKDLGGRYEASMDTQYFKSAPAPYYPPKLTTVDEAIQWVAAVPQLKSAMDGHLAKKRATEREFQQLAAWENNRSPIANETEYFITDIEYADNVGRLDMLGVRWRYNERKSESSLVPVLIEMKYGNGALSGESSGLLSHYAHIAELLSDKARAMAVRDTIRNHFLALRDLELIQYNKSTLAPNPDFSLEKPEVVFLLANYNPRSPALAGILSKLQELEEERAQKNRGGDFDLRFFVSAFAGYAMHHACMLTTAELVQVIDRFPKR